MNKIFWHSLQGNIYLSGQDINPLVVFEIYIVEAHPGHNKLNMMKGSKVQYVPKIKHTIL